MVLVPVLFATMLAPVFAKVMAPPPPLSVTPWEPCPAPKTIRLALTPAPVIPMVEAVDPKARLTVPK